MASVIRAMGILSLGLVLSSTPAQDQGVPVLQVSFPDAPLPWKTSSKPRTIKVTAVYPSGRATPYNGIGYAKCPSDPRCTVNGMEIPIVNGVGAVPNSVVWYKPGENLVQVSTKDGTLKGEARVKIEAQEKDIKLEIEKPQPNPAYLWAGSVIQARVKATANGKAVDELMLKALDSKGVIISPQVLVTDQNGFVDCLIFPPNFVCPTTPKGNGQLEGDARLSVKFFVDANGDNAANGGEPQNGFDEIPLVEPCPQELIPSALVLCRILAEGGVIVAGPALGPTPASAAIEASRKPDQEKAERAILRDACRFLEEQVIEFINSGKWNGKFSDVVKRLEHLITQLRPVERAKPVMDRLQWAAALLRLNPDVIDATVDLPKDKGRFKVSVGFHGVAKVLLFEKGRRSLTNLSFQECTRPLLSSVATEGPGSAVVWESRNLAFQYDCTGEGDVRLKALLNFTPEAAIVVESHVPIPVNLVFRSSSEIDGLEPIEFPLSLVERIVQTACRVTRVAIEIIEPDEDFRIRIRFKSPSGELVERRATVQFHSGIPHGTRDDPHPGAVDKGVRAYDPNSTRRAVGKPVDLEEIKKHQGMAPFFPLRIFPDGRSVKIDSGVMFPADTGVLYDTVRVRAEVINAKDGELVFFRAFDLDDPTSASGPLDDEANEHDNQGVLRLEELADRDQLLARTVPRVDSKQGFFIISSPKPGLPAGARVKVIPLDPEEKRTELEAGDMIGANNIVGVPVREGVAEILFRVSHNPGDNFKIAAACGPMTVQTGPEQKRLFQAEELLRETRNVDRVDNPATMEDENDGFILHLYDGDRRIRAWHNAWEDALKVSRALVVWRYLYVEADRMEATRGDFAEGEVLSIRAPTNEERVEFIAFQAFAVVEAKLRAPSGGPELEPIPKGKYSAGVLRFDAARPSEFERNFPIVGSQVFDPKERRVLIVINPSGAISTVEKLREFQQQQARRGFTTIGVYEDDWRGVGQREEDPVIPERSSLVTRIDPSRGADFSLLRASDLPEENRLALAYIRPDYTLLSGANNPNPSLKAETNLSEESFELARASPINSRSMDIFGISRYWIVYATSIYEFKNRGTFASPSARDFDPGNRAFGTPLFGVTDGFDINPNRQGEAVISPQTTYVALETNRDFALNFQIPTRNFISYTTAHEIAHQLLGIVHAEGSAFLPDPVWLGDEGLVRLLRNLDAVKFTPFEISLLRKLVLSPGESAPNRAGTGK